MAVACFNKLSFNTQTAWLFAPDKLLYWKIFMGAAQTRKPLKRLDLNFKLFGLTCDVNHNLPTLTKNRSDLDYVFNL